MILREEQDHQIEFLKELIMKKWFFWTAMCAASLLNGGAFFGASLYAMRQGVEGVENQAALLFVPFLWVLAAFVVVLINIYTLICGIKIETGQMIRLLDPLRLSGLSPKARAGRIVFMAITSLLMLFGYSLFAAEVVWAAAYALSGGALLLFLYAWRKAAVR